jgi:hypothetical protein
MGLNFENLYGRNTIGFTGTAKTLKAEHLGKRCPQSTDYILYKGVFICFYFDFITSLICDASLSGMLTCGNALGKQSDMDIISTGNFHVQKNNRNGCHAPTVQVMGLPFKSAIMVSILGAQFCYDSLLIQGNFSRVWHIIRVQGCSTRPEPDS